MMERVSRSVTQWDKGERVRVLRGCTLLPVIVLMIAVSTATVGSVGAAAPTALVARVAGGAVLVDGIGFYGNEMVQLIGVRYDGSTLPFGNATTNRAGGFSATLPYADSALAQIDARGYGSGAHAVGDIVGRLPYPVVPPGYPYVTPTYPDYVAVSTNPNGVGGYANTGYPYTGAPYGGAYPGPGFNYPQPPSGTTLYPAITPGGNLSPSDYNPPPNCLNSCGVQP